jgi:hypothetical protein
MSLSNSTTLIDYSIGLLNKSKIINKYSILLITIFGLVGNLLTIFVFAQKRFRTNSSSIYMLTIAANDCMYLLNNFFHNTIHKFEELFDNKLLYNLINISVKTNFACSLMSYFHNVLCLISVYVILAYTCKRLSIVYFPISNRFISKNSTWRHIMKIIFISFILNIWVIFVFEIKNQDKTCSIKLDWTDRYYKINYFFITLLIIPAILVIIVCNLIIIYKTCNSDVKRKNLQLRKKSILKKDSICLFNEKLDAMKNHELKKIKFLNVSESNLSNISSNSSFKIKPYYLNVNQATSKGNGKSINSKKITTTLILISSCYGFFNFSYFLSLSFYYYYYCLFTNGFDQIKMNQFQSIIEILEIFYIFNYSTIFYIYGFTGSVFRKQLKYSGKKMKFFFINKQIGSVLKKFYTF